MMVFLSKSREETLVFLFLDNSCFPLLSRLPFCLVVYFAKRRGLDFAREALGIIVANMNTIKSNYTLYYFTDSWLTQEGKSSRAFELKRIGHRMSDYHSKVRDSVALLYFDERDFVKFLLHFIVSLVQKFSPRSRSEIQSRDIPDTLCSRLSWQNSHSSLLGRVLSSYVLLAYNPSFFLFLISFVVAFVSSFILREKRRRESCSMNDNYKNSEFQFRI
jgi:hypothetical protein